MAITKITNPITNNTLVNKINEIIDDKQDILTVGDGINIDNGVISVNAESTTEVDLSNYALNNNVVHLTDNETITGNKTFTSNPVIQSGIPRLNFINTDCIKGTAPLNIEAMAVNFEDINGNGLGYLQTNYNTDKTVTTLIRAAKANSNSDTASASIQVIYPPTGSPYTSAPIPTDTTATNGTQIATTGWVNSTGNNVVHKTGDETIEGSKKFTSDMTISNDHPVLTLEKSDVVKGMNPSTEQMWDIYAKESSNGAESGNIGYFATHLLTNGTSWTGIAAYKNIAGSTDSASIKVFYPLTGNPYTYALTPTDTTSAVSTQIATTGWVNSTGNNIVHLTDAETIAGAKTFIDNPYINNSIPRLRLLNTNITKGTAPSTAQGIAMNFQDKDGKTLGSLQTTIDTSKNVFTYLRAVKANSSTDTDESLMGIYYPATGNPYTRAPAPTVTTSTTSTQIATTGWVNSTGNNLVHLTEDETITGAKTFSNLVIHATDSFSLSILKNTAYSYTQIPNNDIYGGIWFMDKDGEPISEHYGQYNADGTGFAGFNFKNHSGTIERIGINLDSSGSLYTEAPIPIDTTSTTSTKIATTGWVNTIGNNVVHRSDAENINGIKTFKANPVISTGSPYLVLGATGVTKGINPTSNINCNVCFTGSDNSTAAASSLGRLSFQIGSSGTAFAGIQAYKNTSGTTTSSYFRIYYPTSGNPYIQMDSYLRPGTDDTLSFGDASHRWTEIYASTATINTSDERLKQDIENIPDEVLDAWGNVNFYQFKFKDMVKEKGENARIHIGIMAQRIKNIFEAANIDPFKYGLLCYDKWNSIEEEKDDENGIIISALKAGDRYSLRYEECLCMEAAYQRRRADRIEARLTVLEERLQW